MNIGKNSLAIKIAHLKESMIEKYFVTCGIVRCNDFELDQLNTRLLRILVEKDDWNQQDNIIKAINEEDDNIL